MKKLAFRCSVLAVGACWSLATGSVAPAEPAAKVEAVQAVELPPRAIRGTVTQMDGITPYADLDVVLMSRDERTRVAAVKTNRRGAFTMPGVAEGRYVILAGFPGMKAPLRISSGAADGALSLKLPRVAVKPIARATVPVPDEQAEVGPGTAAAGGAGAGALGTGVSWGAVAGGGIVVAGAGTAIVAVASNSSGSSSSGGGGVISANSP